MPEAIPHETWKSCISSRHRERVLLMFSSLSEGYIGQVAKLLGLRPHVVKWALYGRAPYYAPELSLIALGLVRERSSGRGRAFEITPLGRRKARSIVAARNRWAREHRPGPVAAEGLAPASVSWSVGPGLDETSSRRGGASR